MEINLRHSVEVSALEVLRSVHRTKKLLQVEIPCENILYYGASRGN